MKQHLVAYLIQSNGKVSDMPTDELLVALHQVAQGSTLAGQGVYSDNAVVYGFLQALKRAMQTAKTLLL
jgi:hypothetical protein